MSFVNTKNGRNGCENRTGRSRELTMIAISFNWVAVVHAAVSFDIRVLPVVRKNNDIPTTAGKLTTYFIFIDRQKILNSTRIISFCFNVIVVLVIQHAFSSRAS